MPNRMSVTLDDTIAKAVRKIQGSLIVSLDRDVSFTTIVNMLLLGGLKGSDDFSQETWDVINDFLTNDQVNLDKEGLTDNYINQSK